LNKMEVTTCGLTSEENRIRLRKFGPNNYAEPDTLKVAATVCRDGLWTQVFPIDLVPGDVLRITQDQVVMADVTIISLEPDSPAVLISEKHLEYLASKSDDVAKNIGDKCYFGTVVTAGSFLAIVDATGRDTLIRKHQISKGIHVIYIPPNQTVSLYKNYGPLDRQIETVPNYPIPRYGAKKVLLEIHCTAINPADWKLGQGTSGPLNPTLPMIPCYDFSGVVAAIGSSCKKFKPGQEVFGFGPAGKGGGCAQFVAIDEAYLHLKPPSITFQQAAAYPLVMATAIQALKDKAKAKKGEKLFVNGGSTACGSVAIQIAKLWGLTVATTFSDTSKDFVSSLGADILINYKEEKWNEVLKGKEFDIIFDCIGDAWDIGQEILTPSSTSRVVSISPPPNTQGVGDFVGFVGNQASRKFFSVFGNPNFIFFLCDRDNVDTREILVDLVEKGLVKIAIDSVWTLEKSNEAFARSMSGRAKGKIVIQIQ